MPLCGSTSDSSGTGWRGRPMQRKLVVLGDGACGKTSLLNVFTAGYFTQIYEPTVFENYVHDVNVGGQTVELSLWDTAGQEDFARLRSLSYSETHVIMLCFSADNPTSLENVESKWMDEILEYCYGVKLVLVALKCDLRDDPNVIRNLQARGQHPCQYEEGLAVARRIRASRYLECSAKHNRGVNEVFQESAKVSITARAASGPYTTPLEEEKSGGCIVM
ncbi:ras-domain-containing protein [Clavulina sp. PMI_390]|nr:ras-domain-containing protein [Clavulina sp. PMI_390]